jgi:hypothetical protein
MSVVEPSIEECRDRRGVTQQLPQSSTGRFDVRSVEARS